MKTFLNFLFISLIVTVFTTGCKKEDPNGGDTLESQFPDWANLSWVSTDGSNENYPQLEITIVGDYITVELTKFSGSEYTESQTYNEMSIDENGSWDIVTIGDVFSGTTYFDGTFQINESENRITIDVEGNPYYDDHYYVLQMN